MVQTNLQTKGTRKNPPLKSAKNFLRSYFAGNGLPKEIKAFPDIAFLNKLISVVSH